MPENPSTEVPYPHTFFTEEQLSFLQGVYDQARARAQGSLIDGLRHASRVHLTKSAIEKRNAVPFADTVCGVIFAYWPFSALSLATLGLNTLATYDQSPNRLAWWLGDNLAPPCGVWRYGIDNAFYDSLPTENPASPPNGKPPSGEAFLGDAAPLYVSRAFYRAFQFGRWSNPAYGTVPGARFNSVTQNAQNNTYKLYWPQPLWFATPGYWPFSQHGETLIARGARLALEDYSARVLSGEIEI